MWSLTQGRIWLFLLATPGFFGAPPLRAQQQQQTPATPGIERTEPACWAREVPAGETTIEVFFDGPGRAASILAAADPAAVTPEFVSPFKPGDEEGAFSAVARLGPGRVYVLPLTAGGTSASGGKPAISSYLVLQTAGDPRPEHVPPKVVGIELRQGATPSSSVSAAAAKDKDPQTPTPSVLRIAFDRDMNPTTHGFLLAQGDDPIALAANQVVYDRKARTWQATFLARPGIVSVRLNSETNVGFRTADPSRVPAWPVQLSFQVPFQGSLRQTATGGGKSGDD